MKSQWCADAVSGHFPRIAEQMHRTCAARLAARLADPAIEQDNCGCECHRRGEA